MKIVIKKFINEGDNKLVGFGIADSDGNALIIDKRVPLADGKTDEQYVTEALAAGQAQIDEWQASFVNVGKEWDAEAGAFKAAPVEDSE